jgi:hypothetical protein
MKRNWLAQWFSNLTVGFLSYVEGEESFVVRIKKPEPEAHGFAPWRMPSTGMVRLVALVRTDVLEEISTSIRMTVGELGTPLAVSSNRRTLRRNTLFLVYGLL